MSTAPDGLDGDCPPWGEVTAPIEYPCPSCHVVYSGAGALLAASHCCLEPA